MRRRVALIALPLLVITALVVSPVLAKDPEPPKKGPLWETLASLQQQIDDIRAYLDDYEETDPLFGEMDTEAELETQVGDDILTAGEGVSLLTNDAGYLTSYAETDPTVPASLKNGVSWSEVTSKPAGFADGVDNEGLTGFTYHSYTLTQQVAGGFGSESGYSYYSPGQCISAGGGVYLDGQLVPARYWKIHVVDATSHLLLKSWIENPHSSQKTYQVKLWWVTVQ